MNKPIPVLFSGSITSPTAISENNPSVGRALVKVFTKYGNRNGSYITEAVAKQLIDSAPNCPVVGFFDPQSGDWGTHVGPTLASAYGYVEKFQGWETAQDSDGVDRDYAVFSVILFSNYFNAANKIVGKSQSMELDVNSIDGEWTMIDGNEYFVYSKAKMLGFCVLGDEVEPCFSSSAFFSKEEAGETQFEKFSKLLFELKEKVEKLEGGETAMENFENIQETVEEVSTEFEEVVEEVVENVVENNDNIEENTSEATYSMEESEETTSETTYSVEEAVEVTEETVEETVEEVANYSEETSETEEEVVTVDYEALYNEIKAQYDTAITSHEEIVNNYIATIEENKQTIDNLNMALNEANEKISAYEVQAVNVEQARKAELIEEYTNEIPKEQMNEIKDSVNDFTYEELESKLAVAFARFTMKKDKEVLRAPINQPEESDFAKLMKNYKR